MKQSMSRAKQRKEEKKLASDQRERNIGNEQNPSGLKVSERIFLAALKNSVDMNSGQKFERKIINLKTQADLIQNKLSRAMEMKQVNKIDELENRLDDILIKMNDVTEEENEEAKKRSNVFDLIDF